jgi:FkbM family methyltransferase
MKIRRHIMVWVQTQSIKKVCRAIESLPSFKSINLVDVGAAGSIEPRWKSFSRFIKYVGFEPDERSSILLHSNSNFFGYKIYPFGLWSTSGKISFNLTSDPQLSSFFTPNYQILNKFPNSPRFSILHTTTIECKKLDVIDCDKDFIKIDVQGGELEILSGAKQSLKSVIGCEVEVEFLPLYTGQPLFGDISKWLTEENFEFIDFANLRRWERANLVGLGQCVFGDALFLRTPEYMVEYQGSDYIERISKYFFVCLLYGKLDLIDSTINLLGQKEKEIFSEFCIKLSYIKLKNERILILNNRVVNRILQLFGRQFSSHLLT